MWFSRAGQGRKVGGRRALKAENEQTKQQHLVRRRPAYAVDTCLPQHGGGAPRQTIQWLQADYLKEGEDELILRPKHGRLGTYQKFWQ